MHAPCKAPVCRRPCQGRGVRTSRPDLRGLRLVAKGRPGPSPSQRGSVMADGSDGETVRGIAQRVPYTTGTEPPRHAVPVGATDAHHHIFDPRFPPVAGQLKSIVSVADYLMFRKRLGLSRSIVVGPGVYADDNSCLIDAMKQLDGTSRGVCIVRPDVGNATLDSLHSAGVRGMRVYLGASQPPTPENLRLLAHKAADRGWHLDIVCAREGDLLADWQPLLESLPCMRVVDHFGYPSDITDLSNRSIVALRRMLDSGQTYVKLSGVYIRSKVGFPTYADVDALATELIRAAPERTLWGSDWPHAGAEANSKPDAAGLIDQTVTWCSDTNSRRRLLVDNPTALYWADETSSAAQTVDC